MDALLKILIRDWREKATALAIESSVLWDRLAPGGDLGQDDEDIYKVYQLDAEAEGLRSAAHDLEELIARTNQQT